MVYVYILKLVKNKFYVGKTTNPLFRLNDHYNGNGASWTKKYKPLTLDKIIPNCDEYDEDKYTIKYMDLYGIQNVRGGTFTQIVLPTHTTEILSKMCRSANNRCFNCGQAGHFIKDCYAKNKIHRPNVEENTSEEDDINEEKNYSNFNLMKEREREEIDCVEWIRLGFSSCFRKIC